MPLGAFIFIDFWLFPRLGLAHYYAERRHLLISWPAAVGWFGSFGICFVLYAKDQYSYMSWLNPKLPVFLANYKADLFFAGPACLVDRDYALYRMQPDSTVHSSNFPGARLI